MDDARAFLDGGGPMAEATLPAHRPSGFTEDLANKITEAIADGMTFREIARLSGFPDKSTFFRWKRQFPEFAEELQSAMDWRTECLIDDMLAVAKDDSGDFEPEEGKGEDALPVKVFRPQSVQRAKLFVDTGKWIAAKWMPAKYGEPQPVLIQPPAQPGQFIAGDTAKLIGESAAIEGNPFEASLRVFEQITGQAVSKIIAG